MTYTAQMKNYRRLSITSAFDNYTEVLWNTKPVFTASIQNDYDSSEITVKTDFVQWRPVVFIGFSQKKTTADEFSFRRPLWTLHRKNAKKGMYSLRLRPHCWELRRLLHGHNVQTSCYLSHAPADARVEIYSGISRGRDSMACMTIRCR